MRRIEEQGAQLENEWARIVPAVCGDFQIHACPFLALRKTNYFAIEILTHATIVGKMVATLEAVTPIRKHRQHNPARRLVEDPRVQAAGQLTLSKREGNLLRSATQIGGA